MPSYLIGAVTTAIRVYARFGVLVGLGLVILAALRPRRAPAQRPSPRAADRRAAVALVGVELANHVPAPIWHTDRPPAYDHWLARQPKGIVAFYPSPGDKDAEARFAREQYFFQTVHGQPLFFSGSPRKSRAWAIRALARPRRGRNQRRHTRRRGRPYVVVDPAVYRATPGEGAPRIPPKLYRRLAQVGGADIYAVTTEPIDLDEALHEHCGARRGRDRDPGAAGQRPGPGLRRARARGGRSQSHWMIQDGFVEVDESGAGRELELAAEGFSAHKPRAARPDRRRRLRPRLDAGSDERRADPDSARSASRKGSTRCGSAPIRVRAARERRPASRGRSSSRRSTFADRRLLAPLSFRLVAPTVSVIVPLHRRTPAFEQCIEAALGNSATATS